VFFDDSSARSLRVCARAKEDTAAVGWFARRIKQPAFIILQRTGTLIKIVTKNYYFFEMQHRSGDDAITFIMPREWCCKIEKKRELYVRVSVRCSPRRAEANLR
jgi:hypothetical protein